jgi:hypothetical protein
VVDFDVFAGHISGGVSRAFCGALTG